MARQLFLIAIEFFIVFASKVVVLREVAVQCAALMSVRFVLLAVECPTELNSAFADT